MIKSHITKEDPIVIEGFGLWPEYIKNLNLPDIGMVWLLADETLLDKRTREMEINRIYFKENPWSEGHPIKEFKWLASLRDGCVWFDMHLKSEDYYSERDIEDDEDTEYPSDWAAPIVWGNYHACTLSSNYWHNGGFKVCLLQEYSPEYIDGLEIEVDPDPESVEDWDDLAFHIYLLGHDSVAKHKIKFERIGDSSEFDITWTGKIAQAYVGDYEYKHDFTVVLASMTFPEINKNA
ncbi:MAG: hypothetical protein ACRBHB_16285 [Arenicella sp.]